MSRNCENIILIMTDQHRYDFLGCTGHPFLKTPNIDALAGESVLFSNAYCAAPVCGPARAAIFTGMYPPASGVLRNHICMSSRRPLLTDRLSEKGYFCALVGKLHLTPCRSHHGFDFKRLCDSPHAVYDPDEIINNPYRDWIEKELFDGDSQRAEEVISASERLPSGDPGFWLGKSWCDDEHHNTTWTGNEAVNFIQNWQKQQPLLLNISFFGPHHPYSTCQPWDSMYDPESIELPGTLEMNRYDPIFKDIIPKRRRNGHLWTEDLWKKMIACYLGAVSQIDREVGRIITALKKAGMWENSVVIFTADHGDELGDFGFLGKNLMNEGSAHIPLMIKPAGAGRSGFVSDCCVNSIDLFATCLELAGYSNWKTEADFQIESRSMASLLNSESDCWNNETFVMDGINPDKALTMLWKENIKLVRMSNGKNSPAYELYDMTDDVPDVRNVFDEESYRPRRDKMVARLESWWQRQKDNYPEPDMLKRLSVRKLDFNKLENKDI